MIEIQREFEMHEAAFRYHIEDLIKSYKKVVLVNLLDSRNQYEKALLVFYEYLLKKYKDKLKSSLKYQYCNFNKENVEDDLEQNAKFKTSSQIMKFHCVNTQGDVISTQHLALRFNSLNTLHRVNQCQQTFSMITMKNMINFLVHNEIVSKDDVKWTPLGDKIKLLFMANGDKL